MGRDRRVRLFVDAFWDTVTLVIDRGCSPRPHRHTATHTQRDFADDRIGGRSNFSDVSEARGDKGCVCFLTVCALNCCCELHLTRLCPTRSTVGHGRILSRLNPVVSRRGSTAALSLIDLSIARCGLEPMDCQWRGVLLCTWCLRDIQHAKCYTQSTF